METHFYFLEDVERISDMALVSCKTSVVLIDAHGGLGGRETNVVYLESISTNSHKTNPKK